MALMIVEKQMLIDRRIYDAIIREPPKADEVRANITVTQSLSVARKWILSSKYHHRRHLHKLQVGISLQGGGNGETDVIALCLGKKILVVSIVNFNNIIGCLQGFLFEPSTRFIGIGPKQNLGRDLEIGNYGDALELNRSADLAFGGFDLQLDPAVGAWNAWPLNNAQLNLLFMESSACYVAGLNNLGLSV